MRSAEHDIVAARAAAAKMDRTTGNRSVPLGSRRHRRPAELLCGVLEYEKAGRLFIAAPGFPWMIQFFAIDGAKPSIDRAI